MKTLENVLISPANGECKYYMTKCCKQALWLNPNDNFYLLQSLAKEITELAMDKSKNEKIAFAFRAIQDLGGEDIIYDTSVHFATIDGQLVTGQHLLKFAKEYYNYAQELGSFIEAEVVYCYYPYNPYNTIPEISVEGKLVTWHALLKDTKLAAGEVARESDILHSFIAVANRVILQ
jgi:hypothetical protein